jgi:hypothetical protein
MPTHLYCLRQLSRDTGRVVAHGAYMDRRWLGYVGQGKASVQVMIYSSQRSCRRGLLEIINTVRVPLRMPIVPKIYWYPRISDSEFLNNRTVPYLQRFTRRRSGLIQNLDAYDVWQRKVE